MDIMIPSNEHDLFEQHDTDTRYDQDDPPVADKETVSPDGESTAPPSDRSDRSSGHLTSERYPHSLHMPNFPGFDFLKILLFMLEINT
jgi:hypothetical protein